jgi:thiamine biosynthesis protein ThiS
MDALKINGVERQFAPHEMPATLAALLQTLGVEAAAVVAEVDGQIVRRENYGRTEIKAGQQIELIKFMGGG